MVEVLLALVLFSVGALATVGFLTTSWSGLRFSGRITEAQSLAQEKMEWLRQAGRWGRGDGADRPGRMERRWRRTPDPAFPGRISLKVTVFWEEGLGTRRELALESMIFDPMVK